MKTSKPNDQVKETKKLYLFVIQPQGKQKFLGGAKAKPHDVPVMDLRISKREGRLFRLVNLVLICKVLWRVRHIISLSR